MQVLEEELRNDKKVIKKSERGRKVTKSKSATQSQRTSSSSERDRDEEDDAKFKSPKRTNLHK